ncbi:magnesium-transporting ATPase (P-type) [Crossiella equi]|uniref:Magnesium-transporting ATPase (P-type) n=2 Tax=Crossiella equi TaxID=130796 RepID=A0ABS5AP83_9PSEU|nr:magnesium-transporting ATPase (P-type) [Crossiella equi]
MIVRPAGLRSTEVDVRKGQRGQRARTGLARFLRALCGPPGLALVLAGTADLVLHGSLPVLASVVFLAAWTAWIDTRTPPPDARRARVVRDGRTEELPVTDLVVGDLVELRRGDVLPAPLSIVEDNGLEVVDGVVLRGTGRGEITSVPAPVPERRPAPGAWWVTGAAALLTLVLVLRVPEQWMRWLLLGVVLGAVAWLVRPAVLTALAHSRAAKRMSRADAVLRNPEAADPLARVTVLCFDGDGLLTTGVPEVSASIPAAGRDLSGLWTAVHRVTSPDAPVDAALLARAGEATELPGEVLASRPYATGRRWQATVRQQGETRVLTVLGAPEAVLPSCVAGDTFAVAVTELAQGAHRVLVLAEAEVESTVDISGERPPGGLTPVGLLGITDAVRDSTAYSVRELRRAGIRVVLISGEHPATATALASQCGISRQRVLTPAERAQSRGEDRAELLHSATVLARCAPELVPEVVAAHKRSGEVVALSGGRPEDVPALLAADVGIATGGLTAPLVVSGDQPRAVVEAVRESRRVATTLRVALGYLLTCLAAVVLALFGAAALFPDRVPTAEDLAVLVVLAGVLPASALVLDRPTGDPLYQPPVRQPWVCLAVDALAVAGAALLVPDGLALALLSGLVVLVLTQRARRWPFEHNWAEFVRVPLAATTVLVGGLLWFGVGGGVLALPLVLAVSTLSRRAAARTGGWGPQPSAT